MEERHLHIVSFDIPLPANYGGIIDVWYRIKALCSVGIKVHLHCFSYGRKPSKEIESICESVVYYPRKTGLLSFFSLKPYIVYSRRCNKLLENLMAFDAPILFEGVHTTMYINSPFLKDRMKIVRAHNIEHDYYKGLQHQEKNIIKKIFFFTESFKLKLYASKMKYAQMIATVSPSDTRYFKTLNDNVVWIPSFHVNEKMNCPVGYGSYILYHGDLSISDGENAAKFLITSLNDLEYPIIIAGRNPSKSLQNMVSLYDKIKLIINPTQECMNNLIEDAQIIVLPTFQATGLKLKLLISLFAGRHCIANTFMVKDTGMDNLCFIADTPQDLALKCKQLINIPFTERDIEERQKILKRFENETNLEILVKNIFH